MIDDNIINKVWEKGLIDSKFNPDFVRKDAGGVHGPTIMMIKS